MATRIGSTAKWTTALASVRLRGSRSVRYCAMACSTPWPVSGFLSSAVAQHVDDAAPVQLLREAVCEPALRLVGVATVTAHQLGPLLALGGADEGV